MKIIAVLIALGLGLPVAMAQTETPVVSSIELTLKTPTGDLYGTYTGPRNVGIIPVVLIIPGSGPTDRDGNSLLGIQTNAYKLLAEELARNKIASLRIDKRGIGKSKSAVKNESDLRFDTYVDDAAAWINSLKTEHNYEKVYVLGHSEGSLVGMLAAQREKISGFISLAGSGRSVDVLLREQLKSLPLELLNEATMIMDSLKAGKTSSEVNPGLMAFFRPSVQPYMISWIKYDPVEEINKLKVPTLIIQGTNDIQVTKEDAILLSKSKPSASLLFLENMNHVLKDAGTDLTENLATYKNPDLPINAQLIKVLTHFITVVTK